MVGIDPAVVQDQIWSHATPAGPDHNTRAEAACRAYQQSLGLAPNRTSVALKLANLLLLMGRTDPALRTLHASLKRDPTHAALAAQLARIYDVLATNRPDTAAGQALRRRATHFAHRATELAPGFRGPLDIRILQPIIERGTDSEPPADAAPPASRMASPEAPQHDRDTATGDDVLIVLPFLLALFAAWLLTPAMRRLAFRIGFLDCPAGRKAHVKATPLLGGVAVYLAIAIGAGYLHHSWNSSTQTLAMCATVLMITGLLDDRYDLGWKIKLTVQSATAIGLYLAGIRVQIDWLPGWVNVVLSTVWLMGITNAVNFLDNMNGLASGLALVAAGFFALMAMMNQCLDTAIMAAAVAGACLGFLRFNRPRALIFLGDAGSLTLGLLLAGIGLELRFTQNPNWITWMVPILVLGVPIFDMALVCISRLRHGLNPLATPGHDHSSHRLAKILGSRRRAVITLWFAAITCGILGMLVMNASLLTAYVVLGLFLILFVTGLVVAETRYPARYPARKKAHQ